MKSGEILEIGNLEKIFKTKKHPYTKKLLNSVNYSPPKKNTSSTNILLSVKSVSTSYYNSQSLFSTKQNKSKILNDIKKNKIKALIKYEKKFSKNTQIKPSINEINNAIKFLDPNIKKAIDFAYKRILNFHNAQKTKNIFYKDNLNNKIEYKYVPIQSIGIYVPANLPSTLLMNAIPAKIAGVKRIVLANPKNNGKLNPAVLYLSLIHI